MADVVGPVVGTLRVKIVPDAKGLQARTAEEAEAAGKAAEAAAQKGAAKTRRKSRKANVAEATASGAAEGAAHGKARQEASEAAQAGTNKPDVAKAAAKGAAEGKAEGKARRSQLEKELGDFRVKSAVLTSRDRALKLAEQQRARDFGKIWDAAHAENERRDRLARNRAWLAQAQEARRQAALQYRNQNTTGYSRSSRQKMYEDMWGDAERRAKQLRERENAARNLAIRNRQQDYITQRRFDAGREVAAKRAEALQKSIDEAREKRLRSRSRFSRLVGGSGRAGFDTNGGLQRAAKSLAFISTGPLGGIASTLGLIGGKAAVAGGAVAALSIGLVGVGAAAAGLAVGAVAFGAFSAAALKGAGALEQQKIAFTTLLKSEEKGSKFLDQVLQFAKETPFDALGVADGAKKLLAYGFAAEDVLPILTDLGDATSALGLGNDGLGRLILAFGQIRTAGKLTGMEARQLSEAGIPVWEILANKIGKTTGEIKKMTEEGAIPAELAIEALREGMQNTFGGSLKAQAASLLGTFEKIKESATLGLYQALLPSLPKIAAELREFAPALEGLSVALGRGLGTALTDFLDGIGPALNRATTSLTTLLPALMRDWTPAYTTITSNLLNAFTAASPGIRALSGVFADVAASMSGALVPVANKFTDMAVAVAGIKSALEGINLPSLPSSGGGLVDSLMPDNAKMLLEILQKIPGAILEIRWLWLNLLQGFTTGIADVVENFGPLGRDLAAGLRFSAANIGQEIESVLGKSLRAQLPVDVEFQLQDVEAGLANLSDRASNLPVNIKTKLDLDGIRTGSLEALRELASLSQEDLLKVNIDKAALEAQIASLESFFGGLSPEILATINADTSGVESSVSQAKSEAEKQWTIAVNTGSVDSLLEKAAQANQAISQTTTSLAIYDKATGTAKLFADADPAEQSLALTERRIFTYDGRTATADLLALDEASAAIFAATGKLVAFDATKATAVAGLNDQATAALDGVYTALMAYGGAVAIGTAGVNDQASPQIATLRGALDAWGASGAAATVDANSPAAQVIAQAQAALAEWDAAQASGDVNAVDNASAKISGVLGLLNGIPRYIPVTIEARVAGIREAASQVALLPPGAIPGGGSRGGSVPIDGGGGDARSGEGGGGLVEGGGGGRAASPMPTAIGGGYYGGLLGQIVTQAKRLATVGAAAVSKALRAVYDSEIYTQRAIDDERERYYKQLDFGVAIYRNQLEAAYNVKNLAGDAQERARFAVDWQVALREQEVAQIKKVNDRALEDQQRFYDKQKQLADEMAARMEEIQNRVRDTVDWGKTTNPESLIRNLRKTTNVFTEFAKNLAALQARGLSTAAQEALEALDPTQAAKITRRLLDNPTLIKELNAAYGDLLAAGIGVSDRFVDPVKAAGSVIGPISTGITASGKTVGLGQPQVVVNQTINPSADMNERQLASLVGKELLWQL